MYVLIAILYSRPVVNKKNVLIYNWNGHLRCLKTQESSSDLDAESNNWTLD